MVYHIFNYCIQDVWYRDSTSCSDEHFDRTMCALDWKVPANIKIFHYGSPVPTPYELVNPVLLCRPILSIDPLALAEARIHQNVSVYDKHSHHVWPVLRRLGRFVIYQGSNGWPRFSFVDGERISIIAAMEVTPVTLKDALNFVRQNHRHCTAPQGHKYSIGIKASGTLIGVVIASTPKARALDDGRTLELNRICCDPAYRNAVSMVCGAAIRAAKAMGYHRIVTYTLPQESGSSMRAIGFQQDGITSVRPTGWNCRSRPRFLLEKYPYGEKIRWILKLK